MDLSLFLAGCALIAVVPVAADCLAARRRERMLRQEANKLGFSFEENANPFEGSDTRGLRVLEGDRAALTLHVMKSGADGCQSLVFDLAHYVPWCSGLVETTIAAFHCPSGQLPIFQIGEKGFAHRVGDLLQGEDDLEIGRQLDQELFVHCAGEPGSRAFLTPDKIAQLHVRGEHFRIESSHEWILIYRPAKKTAPRALPQFVQTTSSIAAALLGRTPGAAGQFAG